MVSDAYVERRLQRMRVWMELRALQPITVTVYLRCARLFLGQVKKPLRSVQQVDIEQYLLKLARNERSPQTRNVHLAAVRCLLRATVRRNVSGEIPQAKVPRRSPEILSGSEVGRLLAATTSLKYRAIFMLAYGAGLRVSELGQLQTSDINSDRMLIHVRIGKTGPRYVMMSPRLLEALRAYWRAFRPQGPFLFPGRAGGQDSHLSRNQIHKGLRKAVAAAGIDKRVSPHTLRHSFATHLLDQGADVRTVQMLLGHARLESTATYLHLTTSRLCQTKSPLDLIELQQRRTQG